MVTFRFYVVSVVAFFLALAVGVVVGSVLDEGITRGVQERLERVEANLDETVALVDGKNEEIARADAFAEAVAPFAVQDRLPDTTALVVSEPGMATDIVEDAVRRLREAGAAVPGVVWFETSWSLESPEDVARLEEIAGESGLNVDQLHDAVLSDLLGEVDSTPGSTPGASATSSSTTSPTSGTTGAPGGGEPLDLLASPLLARLQDAGFLRVVPSGGEPTGGGSQLAVLAVTGTQSELAVPGSAAADLAEAAGAREIPAVMAEIHRPPADDPDAERGRLVTRAREVSTAPFSTVDDLDLVAGRVAVPLALAERRNGVEGRYGYGPGVDGVLPPWPPR